MPKPFTKNDPRINRKGRPPGAKGIPDMLRRFGELECPEKLTEQMQKVFKIKQKISVLEAIQLATIAEAIKGQPWAVQYIADRTEGKPRQTMAIEEPPKLLQVEIVEAAKNENSSD